ncbi:IS200/IS605 family transposase [Vibrio rarus]
MGFIQKKRQKLIYGAIRKHLGSTFQELAKRKGITIEEGHLMKDHVHMCISVPPKYSVFNVVGYLKGKSAISIAKKFRGRQRNFNGEHFWARGYFVSTVGLDEATVLEYIRNQEQEDEHRVQLKFGI